MHELSLISDLLKKIEKVADEAGAPQVTKVSVQIGPLAHISAEHFREHFIEGVQGSRAQNAELVVTMLTDIHHPHAQDIMLTQVEIMTEDK